MRVGRYYPTAKADVESRRHRRYHGGYSRSEAMSDEAGTNILGLTAKIVSAHVANNQVRTDTLVSLIQSVYPSLSTAAEPAPVQAAPKQPAVPIKKSVFPDYIVCLEDGKKLKMLKRHLQTSYDLSPDAYRAKWGLPRDYPMVAPNYAVMRSTLAKSLGLGRKPAEAPAPAEPEVVKVPARRARGAKG